MKIIIFLLAMVMATCCYAQPNQVSRAYCTESTGTASISPTNICTVYTGVDKYSKGFNFQYSENQSFAIKIDAGSATAFSVSVQAWATDFDGTQYWEDVSPANTFSFTADAETRYSLSLPVGFSFRFKFTADAAAAYEIERLTVYYK